MKNLLTSNKLWERFVLRLKCGNGNLLGSALRTMRTMVSKHFGGLVSYTGAIKLQARIRTALLEPERTEMASFFEIVGAVFTRVIFALHGGFVLWILIRLCPDFKYWPALCVGLCLLAVEMSFTLFVRRGQEYKYFWPSCFFYLCSIVPCIWVLEMNVFYNRVLDRDQRTVIISGVTIYEDTLRKLSEIGLVLVIITGRWILPRGAITRDQLSSLLLEYVAIAADILEIFEALEEKEVRTNFSITLATLIIYSWSLLQFTFGLTSFSDDGEEEEEDDEKIAEKETSDPDPRPQLHASNSRKYLRKLVKEKEKKDKQKKIKAKRARKDEDGVQKRRLHGDVYGILAAIFMQDGPYLVLRLYMIINLNIKGELQFFFAGKNAITIALLLYRLYALQCKRQEDENVKVFRSASNAILGMRFLKNLVESRKERELDNRRSVKGRTKDGFIKQLSFKSNA